ncbi:MAG: NADH dehydrogenase [Bacteroidetes bacterium GWF2_33_16]|nr:MAG: NADH dehydrogenase [Bacteroidetes bacterium GWE2_32_14]OFY07855.1 MAG: NADH dehydrogenase [Bacteroidetes bacterium GWF2_33_16]
MEILEGIITRRSIRKYTNQKVNSDQVQTLIKAGMYAPSAQNQQPWHFIVITDQVILAKIATIHPYAKMLTEAPLGIMVCGDETLELSTGYWVVDCSAATQNILLAAHGLGLGAVWLGLHPREERKQAIRDLFKLPKHIQPLSLISIGYPNEHKHTPDRFKPERIHYNIW